MELVLCLSTAALLLFFFISLGVYLLFGIPSVKEEWGDRAEQKSALEKKKEHPKENNCLK